jgi:hypothetical protein
LRGDSRPIRVGTSRALYKGAIRCCQRSFQRSVLRGHAPSAVEVIGGPHESRSSVQGRFLPFFTCCEYISALRGRPGPCLAHARQARLRPTLQADSNQSPRPLRICLPAWSIPPDQTLICPLPLAVSRPLAVQPYVTRESF